MPRDKFEYKAFDWKMRPTGDEKSIDKLNEIGQKGWEVIDRLETEEPTNIPANNNGAYFYAVRLQVLAKRRIVSKGKSGTDTE